MTDRLNSDIEALFGTAAAGLNPADSDRRARLAADLAAALAPAAAPSAVPVDDAVRFSAYIDQGLSDEEKQSVYRDLASSPAALAEVEAMLALLETVESAPLRAPAAVRERARALLAVPAAAPTLPWWRFSWIARPQARFGLGLASVAFLALFVVAPVAWLETQPGVSPDVADSKSTVVADARTEPPNRLRGLRHDRPPNISVAAPPGSGWAAIAVSPSTHTFGTAESEATRGGANERALAKCAEQGAKDCEVRLSGEAECLALASGRNVEVAEDHGAAAERDPGEYVMPANTVREPAIGRVIGKGIAGDGMAVAADRQLQSAQNKALEACSRAGAGPCVLRASACGG
jgi:hypothetical protein